MGGVNSSAPISGVVAFLISVSMSVINPAMGVPRLLSVDAPDRCRLVADTNCGITETELASAPVAACQSARSVLAAPRKPSVAPAV